MRRLILITAIVVAATVAACGPGTDGIDGGTFPLESVPAATVAPSDVPSVEPSVDASMEATASPS